MKNDYDEMTSLFRKQMEQLEVKPPESVWSGINAGLQRKRRLVIYRYAAAAAMIAVLVGLAFLFSPTTQKPTFEAEQSALLEMPIKNKAAAEQIQHEKAKAEQSEIIKSSAIEVVAPAAKAVVAKAEAIIPPKISEHNLTESSTEQFESILSEATEKVLFEEVLVEVDAKESTPILAEDISVEAEEAEESAEEQMRVAEQLLQEHLEMLKSTEPELEIKTGEKNMFAVSFAVNSIPTAIGPKPEVLLGSDKISYGLDPFQSNIRYETSDFEEIESTTYHPPVSIGIKLNFGLNNRWSLETGILYTELTISNKTFEFDHQYSKYEQVLIYMGVPLGVRFDIWQRPTFQLYLSQTALIEKGIQAINRSLYFDEGRLTDIGRQYAPITGLQFSSVSNLGLNLPIYKSIGFFGEAGLQVFMLNSTQPFNIRSAKKAWPVVHGGIRIKI